MSTQSTKISVNLSPEVLAILKGLAKRNQVTMTEALRRAISTQHFLEEADRNGKAILLRDAETRETERIVLRY